MNPKTVTRITGIASLAFLGYLHFHESTQHRHRREVTLEFEEELDLPSNDTENAPVERYEQFLADIHAEISEEDDIELKRNWHNIKSVRRFDLIHGEMIAEHQDRMDKADVWAQSTSDFWNMPATQAGVCEWTTDPSEQECSDFSDFGNVSPGVQELMNNVSCDASHTSFLGAKSSVWFIIPRAVPLWVEDKDNHKSDWNAYFEFVQNVLTRWTKNWGSGNEIRLSVGLYTTGLQLIPRGLKITKKPPLARMGKFYARPAMTASKPSLSAVLKSLNHQIKGAGDGTFNANSKSAHPEMGQRKTNCFGMVFIQDTPRDLAQLEQKVTSGGQGKGPSDHIAELNQRCTMTYVFIMPQARSHGTPTSRVIARMETILHPGRRTNVPRDPKFSGIWRLNNFAELRGDAFYDNVNEYMCLLDKRALCRLTTKGVQAAPTENTPTVESYEDATYVDVYEDQEDFDAEEIIEYDYEKSIDYAEEDTIDMSVEDACCGGSLYEGKSYHPICKRCDEKEGVQDTFVCT